MSVGPFGPYAYGNLSRDCWGLVGNHCTISTKFRIAATCWQLKTFFESTYNLNIWRDAIEREMWILGLAYAARAGRRDLLDFFILKGADNWYMGLNNAALGGHRDLVDFFISKGVNYACAHAWGVDTSNPEWIRYDFGTPALISGIYASFGNGRNGAGNKIQGSSDASTWTDIHVVDAAKYVYNINGDSQQTYSNYINAPAAYRYIRLYSEPSPYCLYDFIQYIGVK